MLDHLGEANAPVMRFTDLSLFYSLIFDSCVAEVGMIEVQLSRRCRPTEGSVQVKCKGKSFGAIFIINIIVFINLHK